MGRKATHCPGGVCEIRKKEPIQKFNTLQTIIVGLSFGLFIYGVYAYSYKLENKTHIGKFVSQMMMSDEELRAFEELEYQKELEAFENDDE